MDDVCPGLGHEPDEFRQFFDMVFEGERVDFNSRVCAVGGFFVLVKPLYAADNRLKVSLEIDVFVIRLVCAGKADGDGGNAAFDDGTANSVAQVHAVGEKIDHDFVFSQLAQQFHEVWVNGRFAIAECMHLERGL